MNPKRNIIIKCWIIFALLWVFPSGVFAQLDGVPDCSTATSITINSTTAGSIDADDDNDYFELDLSGGGATVTIQSTNSIDMDTYGYIFDSSCNEIAIDDDSGNDYNFKLVQNLSAGIYYICVTPYNPVWSNLGNYNLVVEGLVDDHGNSCPDATSVTLNSTISADIETGGDYDYFEIIIPSEGDLNVYTTYTGDNTDTYGYLRNSSCSTFVSNDDGGTGVNFDIAQTLAAGTYYLSVSHFNTTSGIGSYDLYFDFASNVTWTISASVTGGVGGTISPSGSVSVSDAGSQTFTITPGIGNTIQDVLVDGLSVGAVSSYTFSSVSSDHSIQATFQVPAHLCTDLSDIPLDTQFRAAPANIMFVLDDSGSMDWEFMTPEDDGCFWISGSVHKYPFDDPGDNLYSDRLSRGTDRMKWKSQWHGYNTLYYNPEIDYIPWPTLTDADPDNPKSHPKHSTPTFALDNEFDSLTTGAAIVDDLDTVRFVKKPSEIIIDNADPRFSIVSEPFAGAWRTGEYSDEAYQNTYYYTGYDGAYSAKWSPSLVPGDYDIYIMWHGDSNNSASVQFIIDDGTSTTTTTHDQTSSCTDWVKIASSVTVLSGAGDVTLTHTRSSSSDKAIADAIKYVPVGHNWDWATDTDAYDDHYWYTPSFGDYEAVWTPNLTGSYTIFARWADGGDRSTAVNYEITYNGGTDNDTKDQTSNGGTWVQLGSGSYTLDAGSYITMTHTRSMANDTVAVADAIRFVPAASSTISIKRAHYYTWSESQSRPYLTVLDGSVSEIKYYSVNELVTGTDGVVESGELNSVTAASVPSDAKTTRAYTEERQNFANWYSFYRKRELTATAAISRTISQMQGVYVGFNTINGNIRQPVLGVKAGGVDETSTLLNLLYNLTLSAQGTPLRQGLRAVGRYYDEDDNIKLNGASGDDSPFASAADGGACQQAFAIAMTDGYWNGSSPSVGNQDADDAGNAFDGAPYADSRSDTLADVAMKYYKEDLSNTLENSIQGSDVDPATHQHMVTYGVSFGVTGRLVSRQDASDPSDPATYDYDLENDVYPTWPNPWDGDQEKIDDLLHAGVNGRGLFLSASNPNALIDSLLAILEDVELRIGSASSVSVNGDELYEEINTSLRVFQSSYDSENWSGNVQSFSMNTTTGVVNTDTPLWEARDKLSSKNWDSGRIMATYNGSTGINFRYTNLTASMQTMLDSNATTAQRMLDYLRGDNTYEIEQGGSFRDRIYKLGDIVHSSPNYKHNVLYVGGNDGMMHALDSSDGEELFAYVPNLIFGNLKYLSSSTYTHQYYVDLTPTVSDVDFTAGGAPVSTLLVGGLGKGGQGFYALNVSAPDPVNAPNNPPSFAAESNLANAVLWEYPNAGTPSVSATITGATNASPIVITTAAAHGLSSGVTVEVGSVTGNTAANGRWTITTIDGSTFSLNGSTGNAAYTSGGTATWAENDDLGYTYGRPIIVKSNDSGDWIVIAANGYNSMNGKAVLYIFDPTDGTILKKINTDTGTCNGLSTPIAVDFNYDEQVDYVYAGDLEGNLWKFDLTASNPNNWDVAYKDSTGTPMPVFQARGPGNSTQPITTRPDVKQHCSEGGYLILFATGKYFGASDMSDTSVQTIYGIWDYGDDYDDREYLGSFDRVSATKKLTNQENSVSLLEQTEIYWSDAAGLGALSQTHATYTVDDDTMDSDSDSSNNTNMDGDTTTADDWLTNPNAHAGWYFDLPITGERVTTDPIIRSGHAIVISYIPDNTPCSVSGDSIITEIDVCSGARLELPPFDINDDGKITSDYETNEAGELVDAKDFIHYSGPIDNPVMIAPSRIKKRGRLMAPAIATLDKDTEIKIMSSSTANVSTRNIVTLSERGARFGIRYWFESRE